MSLQTTPNGTYGVELPKPPGWLRPVFKLMMAIMAPMMARRGMPVLALTTTGAKSGKEHEVHVGWFQDDQPGWLIVASYAGSAKNPAWYYNLARNPDKAWITLAGKKIKVRPVQLAGDERQKALDFIAAQSPNYAEYQTKTDREMPVIRLLLDQAD